MEENMRHFGKFQSEEVLILGHNKGQGTVLAVRTGALPGDEQMELRRIASSHDAQRNDYLVPVVQRERHRSGTDWFSYLANRFQRRDGSVRAIPLKDVENMNASQKAFFKGYGRSVLDEAAEQQTAPVTQPKPVPEYDFTPEEIAAATGQAPDPHDVPTASVDDDKLDRLLGMFESFEARLSNLEQGKKTTTRRKSPTRRKTAAKKSSPKKEEVETPSTQDTSSPDDPISLLPNR